MSALETNIRLLLPDGVLSEATLRYSTKAPWEVSLGVPQVEGQTFEGGDLFVALQSLRGELDQHGIMICCNGARRDAWPSPMSRDTGGARKLYIHSMGEPAHRDSLVGIFDEAPPDALSSVQEQAQFHQAWVESIRNR